MKKKFMDSSAAAVVIFAVFGLGIVMGFMIIGPVPINSGMQTYELNAKIYGTETVLYPNVTFEEMGFPVTFDHLVVNATYRVHQIIMGDLINEMEVEWKTTFTSANFSRVNFYPFRKTFFFHFYVPGFIGLEKINPFNGEWETRIMISVF